MPETQVFSTLLSQNISKYFDIVVDYFVKELLKLKEERYVHNHVTEWNWRRVKYL